MALKLKVFINLEVIEICVNGGVANVISSIFWSNRFRKCSNALIVSEVECSCCVTGKVKVFFKIQSIFYDFFGARIQIFLVLTALVYFHHVTIQDNQCHLVFEYATSAR